MKITIEYEGLSNLQAYIDSVLDRVQSGEFIAEELAEVMEEARGFAAEISPVVTGSYQASHMVITGVNSATLLIDPRARNTASGVPVTTYAPYVEEKYDIYAQTGVYVEHLGVEGARVIKEALFYGYK